MSCVLVNWLRSTTHWPISVSNEAGYSRHRRKGILFGFRSFREHWIPMKFIGEIGVDRCTRFDIGNKCPSGVRNSNQIMKARMTNFEVQGWSVSFVPDAVSAIEHAVSSKIYQKSVTCFHSAKTELNPGPAVSCHFHFKINQRYETNSS